MTGVEEALLERIRDHLRADGISADIASGHLIIGIGDASLVLAVQEIQRETGTDSVIVEVGFRLRLWPAEWGQVIQYHSGWAEDDAGAFAQAVHGWLDGVWPVLLALYRSEALRNLPKPIEVATVTGTDQPVRWQVLVGNPLARCEGGMLKPVEEALARKPPFTLLGTAFANAVNEGWLRADGRPWWGHLFTSRAKGQPISQEVSIRGQRWQDAADGLLQFPWPRSDAVMSFRQFFVIQAVDQPARLGHNPQP